LNGASLLSVAERSPFVTGRGVSVELVQVLSLKDANGDAFQMWLVAKRHEQFTVVQR